MRQALAGQPAAALPSQAPTPRLFAGQRQGGQLWLAALGRFHRDAPAADGDPGVPARRFLESQAHVDTDRHARRPGGGVVTPEPSGPAVASRTTMPPTTRPWSYCNTDTGSCCFRYTGCSADANTPPRSQRNIDTGSCTFRPAACNLAAACATACHDRWYAWADRADCDVRLQHHRGVDRDATRTPTFTPTTTPPPNASMTAAVAYVAAIATATSSGWRSRTRTSTVPSARFTCVCRRASFAWDPATAIARQLMMRNRSTRFTWTVFG